MTTIAVISCHYRETALAPFFRSHYAFADELRIIDVSDNAEINDTEKRDTINAAIAASKSEWVIVVDADEFVFHPDNRLRETLEISPYDIYSVLFHTVYRHHSECSLDPAQPILAQRCHGDPIAGRCYGQAIYNKPIIVRTRMRPVFTCGQHQLQTIALPIMPASSPFIGAHWCMADADLAIERRIRNSRDRMSAANFARNQGVQNWDITPEQIRAECEAHRNDPQLWQYQPDGTVRILI